MVCQNVVQVLFLQYLGGGYSYVVECVLNMYEPLVPCVQLIIRKRELIFGNLYTHMHVCHTHMYTDSHINKHAAE